LGNIIDIELLGFDTIAEVRADDVVISPATDNFDLISKRLCGRESNTRDGLEIRWQLRINFLKLFLGEGLLDPKISVTPVRCKSLQAYQARHPW